jgi:hypothetical protein
MPLWGWLALAAVGALLLAGGASSRRGSTSQGDVASRTDADWQALWSWANRLGTTPQILGLLLYEESGMDPGAQNASGCVGINQYCDGTYEYFVNIPKDQYLQLSMAQQLDYVGPYWASKPAGGLSSTRDIFWLSLTPVTWQPNASSDTVVNDPTILGADYAATVARQNPGIAQGRPTITAGDIDAYLASVAASPGWQLALDRIAANDPNAVG